MAGPDRITLIGAPQDAGAWAELVIKANERWPVHIISGSETVVMSDREAISLLRALQQRYPLEALADV